jgi:hypothetical protein
VRLAYMGNTMFLVWLTVAVEPRYGMTVAVSLVLGILPAVLEM